MSSMFQIKHVKPHENGSYCYIHSTFISIWDRNMDVNLFILTERKTQWLFFKALPVLRWILCWPAARPPDVQPGTP